MMLRAALIALFLAPPAALACDYPGPPPGSGEARAEGGGILWAGFSDATDIYAHAVLGDGIEALGLRVATATTGPCETYVVLEGGSVFEDLAPRIADLDGDSENEVIVVETHPETGAALAIYGMRDGALVKLAATPNLGRAYRWLSPAAIADFDGDGRLDVAYVDRPHIGGWLRIWSLRDGELVELAFERGFSNHKIGQDYISGGLRDCGEGPEVVTMDMGWRRIKAARLVEREIVARELGPYSPEALAEAMACR